MATQSQRDRYEDQENDAYQKLLAEVEQEWYEEFSGKPMPRNYLEDEACRRLEEMKAARREYDDEPLNANNLK